MSQAYDEWMSYISKATIVIPIAIVVLASLLILSGDKNQTNTEAPFATPAIVQAKPPVKFDLNGPLVCSYQTKDLSGKAYVKSKKIYAEIFNKKATNIYLLNGDCLYSWTKNTYTGQKSCGLSPMISMAGIVGINNLGLSLPGGLDLSTIFNSCKKDEAIDSSLFIIPKNITFKEVPLSSP